MSIDLERDELKTLGQACRLLPRKPSPATLWRWRTRGINGVKLECVRVGGVWMTTSRAFADFLRQQTAAVTVPANDDPPGGRSVATQQRLKAAGLL